MIAIIGAGPAGNYTAYLLAKAGYDVTIYEEHLNPGLPIQCTGILTEDVYKHLEVPEECITNKMQKVQVYAPDNTVFETKSTDIIVNRNLFDNFLLKKACKAGAKIEKGAKFLYYENNMLTIEKNKTVHHISAEILIGADGPNSKVSLLMGNKRIQTYVGNQATVKGKFQCNTYQVYLGSCCPEFFAWVVPESADVARIGLATKQTSQIYFNALLKKLNYTTSDILEHQGGLIPIYNPNQILQKNNMYLIGDAATTIKSSTGGGIIPTLEAAETLVKCIQQKKNFNKELKRKKLWLHLFLRKFFDQFTDEDYNSLIHQLNKSNVKKVLEKYTRDNLTQLLSHFILKNPLLIFSNVKHLPKLFKAL
ncbi:MAG: NAD(P)/FAD-dependent oxidoreductase [Candidatus Woesearchaeota archaeon]|jgi:geranylgeranyl reductase family protein